MTRTKMVSHQNIVLERMLCADGNNRLVTLQRFETLGLALALSPLNFLLEDVKECNDIAKTTGVVQSSVYTNMVG